MNTEKSSYHGYRFPSEIISHTVWLYHRFCLSLRDVEDLLAERGIEVSYESIRNWCARFGPKYAHRIKKWRGQLGDTWYLDEVFTKINGEQVYLWRAVDQDADTLDVLIQKERGKCAAKRFFCKLLKGQGSSPRKIVTDKLKSYSAAHRELLVAVPHCTDCHANNRAEVSHEPTRQQERSMRGFKSLGQAQRFLAVHAEVGNLFRVGRHLLKACHHRELRARSFAKWKEVTRV